MNDANKKATAVALTLLLLVGIGWAVITVVDQVVEQDFVVRDVRDGDAILRRIMIDQVAYAAQYLPPVDAQDLGKPHKDWSRLPALYWHPQGPVGQSLRNLDWFPGRENTWRADVRLPASFVSHGFGPGPLPTGQLVAVWSEPPLAALPLLAGALAAYARPMQVMDFYEPNPALYKLSFPSMGTPKFTFAADALRRGAGVRVYQGGERALLEQQAPQRYYQAFFVETIRGDLTKLADDLLTQEGMAALMATVRDRGFLAYHVSNRHYDLAPVVIDVAQSLKYAIRSVEDPGNSGKEHYASEWIILARQPENLRHLQPRDDHPLKWVAPVGKGRHIWIDAGPNDPAILERRR